MNLRLSVLYCIYIQGPWYQYILFRKERTRADRSNHQTKWVWLMLPLLSYKHVEWNLIFLTNKISVEGVDSVLYGKKNNEHCRPLRGPGVIKYSLL